MTEVEGGGAGGCGSIFLGGEEGESREPEAIIMRHEDLPDKELYATKKILHITD